MAMGSTGPTQAVGAQQRGLWTSDARTDGAFPDPAMASPAGAAEPVAMHGLLQSLLGQEVSSKLVGTPPARNDRPFSNLSGITGGGRYSPMYGTDASRLRAAFAFTQRSQGRSDGTGA